MSLLRFPAPVVCYRALNMFKDVAMVEHDSKSTLTPLRYLERSSSHRFILIATNAAPETFLSEHCCLNNIHEQGLSTV